MVRIITLHGMLKAMPSFEDWEQAILSVVDTMVDTSTSFPRMESIIFGGDYKAPAHLKPTIDPEDVAAVKQQISDSIREQSEGPLAFIANYNQYQYLFNTDVSKNCSLVSWKTIGFDLTSFNIGLAFKSE